MGEHFQMLEADNRRAVRVDFRRFGTIRRQDGQSFRCQTLDLSKGGISITTTEPMRSGEMCLLVVDPQISPAQRGFDAVCEVRYSVLAKQGRCRVGLQFLQLRNGGAEMIANWVKTMAPIAPQPGNTPVLP